MAEKLLWSSMMMMIMMMTSMMTEKVQLNVIIKLASLGIMNQHGMSHVTCGAIRGSTVCSVFLELGFVMSGVILGAEYFAIFGEEGLIYQ